MGLLDKAREAANQAVAAAQQAAEKGQNKVAEMQQNRTESQLYAALGQAVYAEQRHGGPAQAVADALGALDAHFVAAAQQQTFGQQQPYSAPPPASAPSSFEQASQQPYTPPAQSFEQASQQPPNTPPTPPPA